MNQQSFLKYTFLAVIRFFFPFIFTSLNNIKRWTIFLNGLYEDQMFLRWGRSGVAKVNK